MSTWAVILAGGAGTRFWPLSTAERPKQLLPLAGDRPLLAQAVARLQGLVPAERVLILTGPFLVERVAQTVPEVPLANILAEPRAASTAPALAWAAHWISKRDPSGQMLSLHADWAVGDDRAFRAAATQALDVAAEHDVLVTVGVKPLARAWPALSAGDIPGFFQALTPVAVDVAVLERTKRLAVVTGAFPWDDIGSWDALLRIRRPDARGNVTVGSVSLGDDVRRSVVWTEGEHVAVVGVEDVVVVRANGHTLVMPTGQAERLRALVQRL